MPEYVWVVTDEDGAVRLNAVCTQPIPKEVLADEELYVRKLKVIPSLEDFRLRSEKIDALKRLTPYQRQILGLPEPEGL